MKNKEAINAKCLRQVYGNGNTEIIAMQNASLSISYGEIAGLLGPSGSGKTTFLRTIGLINLPTSGQITVSGKMVVDGPNPLVNLKKFRKKNIGFVFQKSNLIPFLTAKENIQIALEINKHSKKDSHKRSLELLDELGLKERANSYPSTLSGGQQQRIAICRALANKPAAILADEPTASLDSILAKQVMKLFRDVAHKHGTAIIIVTHDHRELNVFDTLYEMEDGIIKKMK
jgi:putative ABC transport system ATP-binding protein